MPSEVFGLLLGLMGLVVFLVVIWATRNMSSTTAVWTRGGAVVFAITGIFALLLSLSKL